MLIKTINTASPKAAKAWPPSRTASRSTDTACRGKVAEIIAEVGKLGDNALLEYTRKFDAA